MAEVTMSQNLNILFLSLARACPRGRVSIVAAGPVHLRNGVLEGIGGVTKTEIDLADVQRKEQTHLPAPTEQLVADSAYALAKSRNRRLARTRGRGKKSP